MNWCTKFAIDALSIDSQKFIFVISVTLKKLRL